MTTQHEERSVLADVLTPLPYAAAFAHLRGAAASVERLRAEFASSDPIYHELLMASQAIHAAHQALIDCVQVPGGNGR